jgi:hypothetical protein
MRPTYSAPGAERQESMFRASPWKARCRPRRGGRWRRRLIFVRRQRAAWPTSTPLRPRCLSTLWFGPSIPRTPRRRFVRALASRATTSKPMWPKGLRGEFASCSPNRSRPPRTAKQPRRPAARACPRYNGTISRCAERIKSRGQRSHFAFCNSYFAICNRLTFNPTIPATLRRDGRRLRSRRSPLRLPRSERRRWPCQGPLRCSDCDCNPPRGPGARATC